MANVTINALKIYTGGLYHKGFIHAKASQRPLLPIEYSSHTNIAHEIAAIRLIIEGSWKKKEGQANKVDHSIYIPIIQKLGGFNFILQLNVQFLA